MKRNCLLMFGSTERCADMLYAVGMFVPDPFIFMRIGGRSYIVLSDIEFERGRRCAPHCHVISLRRQRQGLQRAGVKSPGFAQVIRAMLKERETRRVIVPDHFPLGLAKELERLKVKVKVCRGSFFPEREKKAAAEVKKISAALTMAEVGLAEGIQALKTSRIGKNRRLTYRNAPLTSEKLRSIIDTTIMQAHGIAAHTIVAGGHQACDPHECGHGVLRANEPIVIDVFPRSQKTGYFGDITRTVVKGRASEAVRKLHHTVAAAQEIAFKKISNGAEAAGVHRLVSDFFEHEGYKSTQKNGRMQGFFHGLGHGLGLEIHEAPYLGPTSRDKLRTGNVVTVEPGLYYHGLGGMRLEDVVLVTGNGARNLTRFEKSLEV